MGRGVVVAVLRGSCCAVLVSMLAWAGCSGDGASGDGMRGTSPGRAGGGATSGGSGTGAGTNGGFAGIGNVGNPGQAGAIGTAGTGIGTGGTGSGSGTECASATVNTTITTPVIMMVIDGSGSMCAPFGGSTRWQALRTALLDQTSGLVYRLQSQVVFGTMIYDGSIDTFGIIGNQNALGSSPTPACANMYTAQKAMGECPLLVQVAPALDNAAAIDGAFPATELGGSTPTDKAMKAAIDLLLGMRSTNPDVMNSPQYIILATDGQPNDICMGGSFAASTAIQANVLAEVDRAAAANITTFVISLGSNDPGLQSHLEQVADRGQPNNPDARAFSPTAPEELSNTLVALVGGAIGCEVTLSGSVTIGRECSGRVLMNGVRLPCCQESAGAWSCDGMSVAEPNGWRLKDASTVELIGQECVNFVTAAEASLEASFPCDVFVPE
jgi:hypothetical protein